MFREQFDDRSANCRPVMIDVKTGRLFADDSAEMKIVDRIWRDRP